MLSFLRKALPPVPVIPEPAVDPYALPPLIGNRLAAMLDECVPSLDEMGEPVQSVFWNTHLLAIHSMLDALKWTKLRRDDINDERCHYEALDALDLVQGTDNGPVASVVSDRLDKRYRRFLVLDSVRKLWQHQNRCKPTPAATADFFRSFLDESDDEFSEADIDTHVPPPRLLLLAFQGNIQHSIAEDGFEDGTIHDSPPAYRPPPVYS
ncbi:hypothetical protein JCM8547_001754 [Rhodosporidiobolus lusitaniae]